MIETVLFGVGAAGNKAAIAAIESNKIAENKVHLLNTTLKDVPEEYKINSKTAIKFGELLGGCGKEPEKGSNAMIESISDSSLDLNELVPESTQAVVIVTSIEGGTGSGSVPVMAKYFDMLNIPCHVFAFVGFQDEARGISNSLKFFKELGQTDAILHTIMNSKFVDFTKSHSTAEAAANQEFCKQLEILIGSKMIPSEQNIDDTDHYKIITTPGYMDIIEIKKEYIDPDVLKQNIRDAFNSRTCMSYVPGCKRMAIIVNGSIDNNEAVDSCIDTIKTYTGEPFEFYRHFQSIADSDDFIDIIIAGLAYPEGGIHEMTIRLADIMSRVNTNSKSLSEILSGVTDSSEEFNSDVKRRNNANDAKAKFAKAFNKENNTTNKPLESKTYDSTNNDIDSVIVAGTVYNDTLDEF